MVLCDTNILIHAFNGRQATIDRLQEIGLEQMDEEVHRVFFCNPELGQFNSEEMRFRPVLRT